jgi:hypothetical protein
MGRKKQTSSFNVLSFKKGKVMGAWTPEKRQAARDAAKNRMNFLHKVEDYNGEDIPEFEKSENGFIMNREEKLQSILNTVKILPPNMILNGRHLKENVQALNRFKVTDKMLDDVYANYTHPEY